MIKTRAGNLRTTNEISKEKFTEGYYAKEKNRIYSRIYHYLLL